MWTLRSDSAEQTHELGRQLGLIAEEGLVVCLQGDLGAGKTCFAQGVGDGLGVDDEVVSPTFTLVAEHDGERLPLLHADLYRLDHYAELQGIGFEEQVEDWPGATLIEWADRFPDAIPDDRLWVTISFEGEGRVLSVQAAGPIATRALARWRGDG